MKFILSTPTGSIRRADRFSPLFLAGWVEVLNPLSIIGSSRLTRWKNKADTGQVGLAHLTRFYFLFYPF